MGDQTVSYFHITVSLNYTLRGINDKQKDEMTDATNTRRHHRVLIAGGGTVGLSIAAALLRQSPKLDVAVIDPSEDHYYQPGWTLVGGGDMRAEDTRRRQADVMPAKARWIKETVSGFSPDDNAVDLASGARVTYDFLVVALGLQIDWDAIESPAILSAPKAWHQIIATFPPLPANSQGV